MQSIEHRLATLEIQMARLLAKPKAIPTRRPRQPHPSDIANAIELIREAGTAGVPAALMRDKFAFVRRAIKNGERVPPQLAAAGVLTVKVGKGHWYYIPDFL